MKYEELDQISVDIKKNRSKIATIRKTIKSNYYKIGDLAKDSIKFIGPGVERIAEELTQSFPDKVISVMSSDLINSPKKIKEFPPPPPPLPPCQKSYFDALQLIW